MVPLKFALAVTAGAFAATLPAAGALPAPGMGAVGGTATGAVGAGAAAGGAPPCNDWMFAGAFIISIVPLNLEAGLSFSLKPHFWQLRTSSLFCAPQFVQNTTNLQGYETGYVAYGVVSRE
jgi:hypothetical protein